MSVLVLTLDATRFRGRRLSSRESRFSLIARVAGRGGRACQAFISAMKILTRDPKRFTSNARHEATVLAGTTTQSPDGDEAFEVGSRVSG